MSAFACEGARLRVLHDLREADADVVRHEVQQDAVRVRLRRRVQERVQDGRYARPRRKVGRLGPRHRLQEVLPCSPQRRSRWSFCMKHRVHKLCHTQISGLGRPCQLHGNRGHIRQLYVNWGPLRVDLLLAGLLQATLRCMQRLNLIQSVFRAGRHSCAICKSLIRTPPCLSIRSLRLLPVLFVLLQSAEQHQQQPHLARTGRRC